MKLFKEEGLSVKQLKERFSTTALVIRAICRKAGIVPTAGRERKK